MTQEERIFRSDEGTRKLLGDMLRSDVFRAALSIVRMNGRPASLKVTADALLAANALENARVFGYLQALDELNRLIEPLPKPSSTAIDPPYTREAERMLEEKHLKPKTP